MWPMRSATADGRYAAAMQAPVISSTPMPNSGSSGRSAETVCSGLIVSRQSFFSSVPEVDGRGCQPGAMQRQLPLSCHALA
jgi:hypothetical protein